MNEIIFTGYRRLRRKKRGLDLFLPVFLDILLHTSGDVEEAFRWLEEVDKVKKWSGKKYTINHFKAELIEKGILHKVRNAHTDKPEIIAGESLNHRIRSRAFHYVFGSLTKGVSGNHTTGIAGIKGSYLGDIRPWVYGDSTHDIACTESLKNAVRKHGSDTIEIQREDLLVYQRTHNTRCSSVIMLDISHSMVLYGKDKITKAKRIALALAELIRIKYPEDSVDFVAFGDYAYKIESDDIAYIKAGPFYTNTLAALELSLDILRKKRSSNRRIFMITDGKPSSMIRNGRVYRNSNGLDNKIVDRTLKMAAHCRREGVTVNTFMVSKEPYLMAFVDEFSKVNGGRAFYTEMENPGKILLHDYEKNRKRRL